jgi:hypothetical protein
VIEPGESLRIEGESGKSEGFLKRMKTNFDLNFGQEVSLSDASGNVLSVWTVAEMPIIPGINPVTKAGPGYPKIREERTGILRTIYVSTAYELRAALSAAQAGDEIVLAPGVYLQESGGSKGARFHGTAKGTPENPICLRSADPDNPAVLDGGINNVNSGITLYIQNGSNWIIEDIEIKHAQKGIILDKSENITIRGCYVHATGAEAVAVRDDSSHNRIEWCEISETGLGGQIWNEGIYIGVSYSNQGTYGGACNYNTVSYCIIGPDVKSKGYTCKEGATGNTVEYTTFYAAGMTPDNSSRSFIELQGNNGEVRYNTFRRNNNANITAGIKVYEQVTGWGQNHFIHDNVLFLDEPSVYFIEIVNYQGSCSVSNNKTEPEECLNRYRPSDILSKYPDKITILD